MIKIDRDSFFREFRFRFCRSRGPGGQFVNKVSTKVELLFDVRSTGILSDDKKEIILDKLKNRINSEGILFLVCDTTRSQFKNKEFVIEKFFELIKKALKPVKKRSKIKPSKAATLKRLNDKKHRSEKKLLRKSLSE